jgi:hypothetical protein
MPYFSTVRKIMASCTKKSHGEKDNSTRNENPLKGEKNIKEAKDDVECEDTTTKSSSYTLYIATIIAVLGAICSVGQFDSLTNFIEEFSAGLCATSLTDNLDGSSNGTVVTDFGLSSKYDPILKDGETYDALSAIKSRYVNISVCNILFISSIILRPFNIKLNDIQLCYIFTEKANYMNCVTYMQTRCAQNQRRLLPKLRTETDLFITQQNRSPYARYQELQVRL